MWVDRLLFTVLIVFHTTVAPDRAVMLLSFPDDTGPTCIAMTQSIQTGLVAPMIRGV
jgi:hypothetical protein